MRKLWSIKQRLYASRPVMWKVHDKFDTLNICTVVGFPLGYSVTAAKLAEVEKALKDGANEIDMVVNISDVRIISMVR